MERVSLGHLQGVRLGHLERLILGYCCPMLASFPVLPRTRDLRYAIYCIVKWGRPGLKRHVRYT